MVQVRGEEEKELYVQSTLGMSTDSAFSSTTASANLTFQELRLHSVCMWKGADDGCLSQSSSTLLRQCLSFGLEFTK